MATTNDPSGHWVETALDIAFIAYDVYDVAANGLTWGSGLALAADVACAILPIATGGGAAVRALTKAGEIADTATDIVKVADKADDALDIINHADDVEGFLRAVPENQIGTSQPFKLRKGEDGFSVFEGVTSRDILAELPGNNVPNTTVFIPQSGLPTGTQVIHTPAPKLSQQLSDAHRILIKPEGMSADRFAKELKKAVRWE